MDKNLNRTYVDRMVDALSTHGIAIAGASALGYFLIVELPVAFAGVRQTIFSAIVGG